MKILFVFGNEAPFTKIDLDILCSKHIVRVLHFRRNLTHLIPSVIMAIRGVLWSELVFSWFGSVHSLLPFLAGRLFRRKCVVIASGYDTAAMPEIKYGNMRRGIRRYVGLMVFRLAHRVIAVSKFCAKDAIINARVPLAKLLVVEHGLRDIGLPLTRVNRRGVITVSDINKSNLSRKGLDIFVQTARYLPDVPFTLIGHWSDNAIAYLRSIASLNVEFTGYLSDADLIRRMQTSEVYVQVSGHEGFGMSLAEAMLCGCIPVVTNRGAISEVVGNVGIYVPYGNPQATADAIRKALGANQQMRMAVRRQIVEGFPLEKRRERLLEAIEKVREEPQHVCLDYPIR